VVSANVDGSAGDVFVLVVDGQLPLRQCLHPETSAKEITLPEYYNSFFDLRKEFNAACNHFPESIGEMLKRMSNKPQTLKKKYQVHIPYPIDYALSLGFKV